MAMSETLVSLFDASALEELRRRLRLDPQTVRQIRNALLKKSASVDEAVALAPPHARHALRAAIDWHPLALDQRCDSQQDGATKLLFRTAAGKLIESVVLRIATGRTTLCVSSQAGCAVECAFCATGRMGGAKNLSHREILDQVVQASQLVAAEGRSVRNVVFMGMGEPFHNEEELYAALAALTAPDSMHRPPGRILVSTVGLPDAMVRCARRFPSVKLALSLHSVRDQTRKELIPLARKVSLADLRRAVVQVNAIQPGGTSLMIEYLLLADVNDSLDDARELAQWLNGLRVHVNLIPYNPIDDAPDLRATERPQRLAFARALQAVGVPTTIRYSLGADIAAACGQLVQRQSATRTRANAT